MVSTFSPPSRFSADNISKERRLHYYDRGELISLSDQGIWQVCRGIVQLSQFSYAGDEILLGWCQPNTFFGCWLTHLDAYQAKTLSEVCLHWYSLSEIENSPHLAQVVLSQMAKRMRQTEALLAISGLKRVEDRLNHLLQLLKQEIGESVEMGTRLGVRLTHQNLAGTIGTTRVTITRLLGEFQRQGIIFLDEDRHIIILK